LQISYGHWPGLGFMLGLELGLYSNLRVRLWCKLGVRMSCVVSGQECTEFLQGVRQSSGQTAVMARTDLSVCPSVTFRCFVQMHEDTIVRS